MAMVGWKSRSVNVLKLLTRHLEVYLTGAPPPSPEQRVNERLEQRVTEASILAMTPLPEIQRVSDALPTMVANNPMSKRIMQNKSRTHQCATRRNTPGALPHIVRPLDLSTKVPFQIPHIIGEIPKSSKAHTVAQRRVRTAATKSTSRNSTRLTSKDNHVRFRNSRIISQEAINLLLLDDLENDTTPYIPTKLLPTTAIHTKFEHYAMPMVHPVTGETILSYKKLMKDPVTVEMWQTAFGKDFGGMRQGDDKTGVMTPQDVANMPADRFATYANIVVDFQPQKEDPHRIRITAGQNLINHPRELTTRTADITTTKLHWNSVLSTQKAKYMCLDLKSFYLSAPLKRYEYMRIPIGMFPAWTINQYDLLTKVKVVRVYVYLEMRRAVWGLPQAGILANKLLRKCLAPKGYYECKQTPSLWQHVTRPISFTLVVDDFGMKYTNKANVNHLIECLKENYDLTQDWDSDLYCGIQLKWNYDEQTLDLSMP